MTRTLLIALGLFLLALLAFFCLKNHAPTIEADIAHRSETILLNKELQNIEVHVSGRAVTLRGHVPDPASKDAAAIAVRNLSGVRKVSNLLEIQSNRPTLPDIPEPVFEVSPPPPKKTLSAPEKVSAENCQKVLDSVMKNQKISFESSSSTISNTSKVLLNSIASAALTCPQSNIQISGHTDTRGNEEMNLTLSLSRANAVRAALISRGLSSSRLSAIGFGETQALTTENNDSDLAKNRRIEFKTSPMSEKTPYPHPKHHTAPKE